ncbi:right-handed parallel beta-helix repeat-containing protein [Metabacillus sp. GX 13764]|uniref:right-handed parallel beta-helix repeat-containing protein n=1 Tax=Metabacillus kandeliae TaxID=2900151 RepID=UPI001E2F8C84|nr:right-handed parallel beta-helix repeat-containing protein [Metabacillus kandeliae]MCD7032642.1 right-handed parallel beta-helix repeat-containing protein [Metabacillus kandeliae]
MAAKIYSVPEDFPTIQQAIDAAEPNGTISVAPGVYHESVYTAGKPLTLLGAQHGKDARERIFTPRKESIISGTVFLEAEHAELNGFIIRNSEDYAGVITSAGNSGYRILNNVIEGNAAGIYMNTTDGSHSFVKHNVIRDNTLPGRGKGDGIYSDQGLFHTEISNNYITGHCDLHGAGINLESAAFDSDILIYSNYLNQDHSIVLTNTRNVRILQNCLIGSKTAAVFFGGGTVRTNIKENVIAKNKAGILVTADFVMKENSQITIRQNEIKRNEDGLIIALDSYSGILHAEDNFWGHDSGPSLGENKEFGDTIKNLDFTATITSSPFLTAEYLQ